MRKWALQTKTVLTSLAITAFLAMPQWLMYARVDGHATTSPDRESLTAVLRTARNLRQPDSIPTLIERLRAAGVSEAWIQFKQDETDEYAGGEVFYPSQAAPVAEGFEDDRMARLVEGLADAGIRVCGWVPCLNDAAAWKAHPEWRASKVDEAGSIVEQQDWLCPSSSEAVAYEAAIIGEVTQRYPRLSAIYTDFIRYDSDFSCVCARCLARLRKHADDLVADDQQLSAADVREAAVTRGPLWEIWTDVRARTICDVVDTLRDRIEEARPDMWFGACVLPFSASDYSFNTQSGQDYYEMARVGLDELVVMGYWDDWGKSPQWLAEGLRNAKDLVRGECKLGCLLDGDMSLGRTWRTLDAIRATPVDHLGYFNYWEWRTADFERVEGARRGASAGSLPRPRFTAVSIRIDTEPDDARRYDTVSPQMITSLVDMFDEEGIKGTFVTCGRIAELQPEAVRYAAQRGHEIACHAYDHEQLDALTSEQEREAITRGLDALAAAGVKAIGFGAPRNSITENGRDLLIERGLAYDGSAAYDPMTSLIDAGYASHSSGDGRRIMVVPFIMPNDWDALRAMKITHGEMERMWRERLARVVEMGEPVFVLDIHQWLASDEQEMDVLRRLIRYVKSRDDCRFMTLHDAAMHAAEHVAHVERVVAMAGEEKSAEEFR